MFPQLPSGNNPYVGAAGNAASHAASLLNALHSAANQAAQLKREKEKDYIAQEQRGFENEKQLRSEGAVPGTIYADGNGPQGNRPTLQKGDPNPAAQGGGQRVVEPFSQKEFYIPTEQEQGKTLVPTGQLGEALQKFAGWDGKTPLRPTDSHSLMQAIHLAQPPDGEPFDIDTSGKFQDAQGNPAPVTIGKKTGTVRLLDLSQGAPGGAPSASAMQKTGAIEPGTQLAGSVGAGGAPGGPFSFAVPEKPERKEGPEDWTRIITDPNSDRKEVTRATNALKLWRAPGTEADKDRDLTRTALAGDRADRKAERAETRDEASKKVFRSFEATKKKAISEANKNYKKALDAAFDPATKKAAADQYRSELDDAQKEYESAIETETGSPIPHNTWAAGAGGGDPKDPAGVRPKGKPDPLGIR